MRCIAKPLYAYACLGMAIVALLAACATDGDSELLDKSHYIGPNATEPHAQLVVRLNSPEHLPLDSPVQNEAKWAVAVDDKFRLVSAYAGRGPHSMDTTTLLVAPGKHQIRVRAGLSELRPRGRVRARISDPQIYSLTAKPGEIHTLFLLWDGNLFTRSILYQGLVSPAPAMFWKPSENDMPIPLGMAGKVPANTLLDNVELAMHFVTIVRTEPDFRDAIFLVTRVGAFFTVYAYFKNDPNRGEVKLSQISSGGLPLGDSFEEPNTYVVDSHGFVGRLVHSGRSGPHPFQLSKKYSHKHWHSIQAVTTSSGVPATVNNFLRASRPAPKRDAKK